MAGELDCGFLGALRSAEIETIGGIGQADDEAFNSEVGLMVQF